MTPERLHDLAARTRDSMSQPGWLDVLTSERIAADRERLASDLASYDLAVEGLTRHRDDRTGYCLRCRGDAAPEHVWPCPDTRRYTALRDGAERRIVTTARLYEVEPLK